jgi:hypothetical protein
VLQPCQRKMLARLLRQKWSRGQVESRLANLLPCLIGMEACVGAHHLSRKLKALGHDERLMPAKYVRPYSKGQKNDYRDAEAIAALLYATGPVRIVMVRFVVFDFSPMLYYRSSICSGRWRGRSLLRVYAAISGPPSSLPDSC